MLQTRVAVLRGGPSPEYEVSLQSGSNVLKHLPDGFRGLDIFIDKDGLWHRDGIQTSPYSALKDVDVVWNALHGDYGEDGRVQQELTALGVPFTGSGVLGSALAMNKILSKERYREAGLTVPESTVLSVSNDFEDRLFDIFKNVSLPVVVKPHASGSSFGVTLAHSLGEVEQGVRKAFEYSPTVLIEEYIPGKEATVGVVEGLRGEGVYALSPIEIVPTEEKFFDYDAKYKGRSLEICPGNFSESDTYALREMAKAAHDALGLRHYSRSDFIVSPDRGIYILETNALPGLTPMSLVPKALQTANISMGEFIKHILTVAIEKS